MSVTLSLTASDHVFVDHPYQRSNTLSTSSTVNVQTHSCRHASLQSRASLSASFKEETASTEETSSPFVSTALFIGQSPSRTSRLSVRNAVSHRTLKSTTPANQDSSSFQNPAQDSAESFQTVDLRVNSNTLFFQGFSSITEENPVPKSVALPSDTGLLQSDVQDAKAPTQDGPQRSEQPFKRLLSLLRRASNRKELKDPPFRWTLDESIDDENKVNNKNITRKIFSHQRNSNSHSSSSGILTAVRTATVSLAESSATSKAWIGERVSLLPRPRFSLSGRGSHDSSRTSVDNGVDEFAWNRSVQRSQVIRELVESEESYVSDLKALVNVYFTLLASLSALSPNTRASIRGSLTDILHLHEALLGELRTTVPLPDCSRKRVQDPRQPHFLGHARCQSADSNSGGGKKSRAARLLRHSIDVPRQLQHRHLAFVCDPKAAVAVAKVFEQFMSRFFVYEEYAAKYETMASDMASTCKTLSNEQGFDKGIEILSRTLESMNSHDDQSKKSLTFADLIIKPIQRICKYPLLFADLCKYTPVSDGPDAHAKMEKVLFRLRETAREINEAKNDPKRRELIEKTWKLQDRLVFPLQASALATCGILGHVILCGVLHLAYQSSAGVKGQYILCALFKSFLVLGAGDKSLTSFHVVASVPLINISIEESDNGRGIQCHTAPFSWKITFEWQHRLYEILFSACSSDEESQWRKKITERSCIENFDFSTNISATQDLFSILALDLKPVESLFGQPRSLARRISIHRAATYGPKSHMTEVIIKNTHSFDQGAANDSTSNLPISRSQSLISPGQVQVLAPRRSERVQLEAAMADIWTRDLLPFPGMKQTDNSFRASANHVIRKLSMASITSTFSKRSSSHGNLARQDNSVSVAHSVGRNVSRRYGSKSPSWKRTLPSQTSKSVESFKGDEKIDFHKNPEKFLPKEFGLEEWEKPRPARKKMTIRATANECPDTKEAPRNMHGPKLRKSVTILTPPSSKSEALRQPLKPMAMSTRPAKSNGVRCDPREGKENIPAATKVEMPLTRQLRRLFN